VGEGQTYKIGSKKQEGKIRWGEVAHKNQKRGAKEGMQILGEKKNWHGGPTKKNNLTSEVDSAKEGLEGVCQRGGHGGGRKK